MAILFVIVGGILVLGGAMLRNAIVSAIGFVIVLASLLASGIKTKRGVKHSQDESEFLDPNHYPHDKRERPQRQPKGNFRFFGSWKPPFGGSGW